ncbi:T9SS sorting signal type C domain-containing protein [Flavobacterium nackdongense]|uniref:T9SS sorting signal type C domain-containing protein n=1 Tax=Flavobacterium nackdongense TaxID=2547394 RepID=A0A4P6YE23_9FLAO|nr:T9SS sorting signal type C domain-containing protein [Flavobacterium nackdongense]QBN19144.1 T9SS sorting signal type C domain-containing protein [Flavobacterium nackdongense]
MRIYLLNLKMRVALFFLMIFCFVCSTYGQTSGDYRSVSSGNWSTVGTWQRHNGTSWVVAPDYPGQSLPCRVFISDNTTVTADVSIFSNKPTRLEFTPLATNAVLNINPNISIEINGNVVIASPGSGVNYGDAILNVGAGSLAIGGILSLNDTQGPNNDCELRIGSGSVTVLGTEARMLGVANENAIIFDGSGFFVTNASTISLSGGSLVAGTGTVEFNGTGVQTINNYNFNNLVLSGSGIKTIVSGATIANNLTITGTAKARITSNFTIPSLIFSAIGQTASTYGSTLSVAAVKNDTYFDNTTGGTGIITVTNITPDITPTIGTYTYTGVPQGPNTATNTGTGTSYTYSYQNSGAAAYGPTAIPPTNAGNYTVVATVAANGTYASRTSAPTLFTIAKKNLTITANSDSKLVGLTYTVGANSTAFSSFGLQNGETIGTITTASTGAINTAIVGSYPIVPSAAVGGTFSAANYTIGYTNGTLTVSNASTGDYRSRVSGVWTDVNTWERWDGSAWVTPPATYPSQTTGTGVVYISDGHAVTSGTIFVPDANRASRIELSAGTATSSLTIDGTSTLGASGGIRIRPSTLTGVTRTINVGNGRLNAGNILIEDTGNDGIDSEIIIGNGTVYLGNGNAAMGGNSLRNAIRFSGSGTLQLDGGSGQILGGTIVAGSGRVSFSDSANQNIGAYSFNNLTLTDAGVKTINAAATITGTLTISGSAKAQLPTGANIPVNSLILDTDGKLLGSWGSTASSPTPTYNDDSHFNTNTTAGIITVTKSTPNIIPLSSYVYNGNQQGSASISGTGTPTFSYVNSGGTTYGPSATPPTNAGNYILSASVAANGDFVARTFVDAPFSIAKAPLTITANNGLKEYLDTFTVGAVSTAFTSTGLQAGQTIGTITTASTGAVGSALIGTYPIVPTAAIGGTFAASNYTITYTDGALTVNPRIGDYRSVSSGNWNSLTTWERWTGSAWATPIAAEGYPGQIVDLRVVHIQPGHNINGNITTVDPRRIRDLIFLDGPSASSLSIIGGNSIKVNNQVIVRSGANRDINVGVGFLSVGSFNFTDTGSDSIVSKLTIGTGIVFASGNLVMNGSAQRNVVEFTGSGSLQFINSGTMTGGSLIPSTGTVYYNSTGNQAVGTYAYTNLVLGNNGIKTVSATTTIAANLTINGTASASLNTGTVYTIDSLTLGCLGREDGSWGSTSPIPMPAYTDDTYFENTTGFLNVATNTRPQHATLVVQTCEFPGKITVSPPPIIGATSYTVDGTVPDVALITNTSGVFSGLAPGVYQVYTTSACGNSQPTLITINPLPTKTWNGTSWSPSGAPTADHNIEFTGNYSENTDVTACACTVNSGTVTFPTGRYLKLGGKLTVNTPGTLTFENNASLVQTTNYIGTNNGSITYKRNFSGGQFDYTYWSSPVANQKLLDLSPLTKLDKFYSFNPTANDWDQAADPATTNMAIGKGYIIRGVPSGPLVNSFIGEPVNGNQSIAVVGGASSNLIGNPYPSALDADAFILANASAIDGTLYFWTHNTPIAIGTPNPGTGLYAYSGNDYATYTLAGGVATKAGNTTPEWVDSNKNRVVDSGEFTDNNGNGTLDKGEWIDANVIGTLETGEWTDYNKNNFAETGEWTDIDKDGRLDLGEWTDSNNDSVKDFGEWTDTDGDDVFDTGEWVDASPDKVLDLGVEQISNKPTGYIAAGQSFFTTSTSAGGPVNFTNAMRVDGSSPSNNSDFFKTRNLKTKTNTSIEKNRVWLNLTNSKGAFKQTLVGYITGATNSWDNLYDGESFDGNDFLDFYSINEEKNLTVQGRALPFDENDEVSLGYRIDVAGSFTIKIDEADGLLKNQEVLLEDKLTKNIVNLKAQDYIFSTLAGTFNDRFVLRFKDNTLGLKDPEVQSSQVLVSIKNKQIKINSFAETIEKVTIFDLAGRQIYQKDKLSSNELILADFISSHQALIVKTTLENGSTVSDKIIY